MQGIEEPAKHGNRVAGNYRSWEVGRFSCMKVWKSGSSREVGEVYVIINLFTFIENEDVEATMEDIKHRQAFMYLICLMLHSQFYNLIIESLIML